jgi:hypothetical protein
MGTICEQNRGESDHLGFKDEAHGKEYRTRRDDRKDHEERGDREYREGRSYFHQHGYTHLDIPPGHLPPPGECRIWYPGKPPGHQPPPGKCGRLRHHVPAGAWLIQRPGNQPQQVDVEVYDASRPGIVISIGIFEVQTGAFIRLRPQ